MSNGFMVSNFLKALEKNSSLLVTVVSSAVNFLFTGVVSNLVLQEKLGLKWMGGASLIILGILLIAFSQGVSVPKKENNQYKT